MFILTTPWPSPLPTYVMFKGQFLAQSSSPYTAWIFLSHLPPLLQRQHKAILPFKRNNLHCLTTFHDCLASVKNWLSQNFLQLNPNKIEVLLIGPDFFVKRAVITSGPLPTHFQVHLQESWNYVWSESEFESHITKLVQSYVFQFRGLGSLPVKF